MSLISVNFDRFIAVTRPFRYPELINVPLAVVITLGSGIWLFAMSVSALNSFIMPGRSAKYLQNVHACTVGPIDPTAVDKTGIVMVILFITVPLGLTLAMFLRLYVLARFHAAKIAAQEKAVGKKSSKKAFTTFFIMTVCLTAAWFPIATLHMYENLTRKSVSPWLGCFAHVAVTSNTVINVMIYYLRNTAFRQTAKRIVVSRFPNVDVAFQTPVIPLDSLT